MYRLTVVHSVWGEDVEYSFDIDSLDDIPSILLDHIVYLENDTGYDLQGGDDDLGYTFSISVGKYENVDIDDEDIFSKTSALLAKKRLEQDEKWDKQRIEDAKRMLAQAQSILANAKNEN